jgi:sortase A
LVLIGGLYVLALFFAPAAAPYLVTKPISVEGLSAPNSSENRIILPRIGVNIPYAKDADTLDGNAEWRSPTSGNPEDGGNFVIAARHFSLQATPLATIEKSPFYNISKLMDGDKIVVDYQGKRYGYEIEKTLTVNPTEIAIEARTNSPTLTLYSVDDASDKRFVIQAKRLGELATY